MELSKHLKKVNFEKYLNKLNKKLKNKTVIIYGTGLLFQCVKENYDLSGLNIIGISDIKYNENQEGQFFLGYKIIPKKNILNYKPDVVLVATLRYLRIIEDFEDKFFTNSNVKVYPLVKVPFLDLIREIWSK